MNKDTADSEGRLKSITTLLPNNVFINALTRFIMMIMVLDYVLDFLVLVFELVPVLVPVLIVVFVIAFVTHNRVPSLITLLALALFLSIHVEHIHNEPRRDHP